MAQSRRKQLEKLEIVDAPERQGRELSFRFEYDIEPYDELVILKVLSIRIGTRTLLEPLDYTVHRGDKLVIAGPNGAGKSTLLQVLDGKRRPSGGMVRLGTGAKPGIFTQQQARRTGRVIDAIWNQYPRFTELDVRSHLARFGYRGEEVFKDCATLSGGELARLRFAELALERPNLLFLDEPTNHLDIYMRESLTQALAAYTGTLLLVTHDRYLMQTLGCPILYLEDGKAPFYRDFEALRRRIQPPPQSPPPRRLRNAAAVTARSSAAAKRNCAARSRRWRPRSRTLARRSWRWNRTSTTPMCCATICCCGISVMRWTTRASASRNVLMNGRKRAGSWKRSKRRKPLCKPGPAASFFCNLLSLQNAVY